jgi:tetratricopeptide (TPR) repeat protein
MKNLARDYAGVGVAYYKLNNSREALSYHQRALEIDEGLRNRPGMAADYRNIGTVLSSDFSKLKAALSSNQKALEIHKELKDVTEMARDYNNIADAKGIGESGDGLPFGYLVKVLYVITLGIGFNPTNNDMYVAKECTSSF